MKGTFLRFIMAWLLCELRNVRQRGGDFVQQALGTLVEILGGPAAPGPGARLDVRPQASSARDAAPAELAAQALVAVERGIELARAAGDALREAQRVERRLGHAHADMRARNEGGIAEQRDPPEREARRLDVEDRLEEGLRALHDLGDVRREQRARVVLEARDHIRPDERR